MKKISLLRMMMLSLIMATGSSSCSSDNDNLETELPPYIEEKVPVTIGVQSFTLSVFDSSAGRAFKALLPLTISMEDVNGNEKFYRLSQGLPQAAANPGTIRTGDLNLYGSDGLVLFYKTFSTSYSYTRIGTIENPASLESALGSGSVNITFGETPESLNATLTYNINGADYGEAPETVTDEAGTAITLDNGSSFSRSGYTFAGWNTSANGNGSDYEAGSNYTLTANTTLYAKWSRAADSNKMKINIGSTTFNVSLTSNPTAAAFKRLLPLTINMSELNNNEKYYDLPQPLPTSASNPGTIQNGDLMLYGSGTLVLFYKTFSTPYSYTRIGRVDNPTGLQSALGAGNIIVTFE
jgi:uncharacterized repeat protein (TIGR02543 family)